MPPFKEEVSPALVADWAARLNLDSAWVQATAAPLDAMELKDRVVHLADALRAQLPAPVPAMLEALQAAAFQPPPITGLPAWPTFTVVERHALSHPQPALETLGTLTHLFSAEFAVRPYIQAHPELAMQQLLAWTDSDDEHRRRLASEGCRTRLPWGQRLRALQAEPAPILRILDALKDDPAEYVRRSVANNLNDLSKDHPELVLELAEQWWEPKRERLLKHALRTLIKAGHPQALSLLGAGEVTLAALDFQATEALTEGEHLELALDANLPHDTLLVVDFALHLLRKDGSFGRKVFKWRTWEAQAGPIQLRKRHPIKAVTVRKHYPGTQRVELLVNGRSVATRSFELQLP